MPPATLRLSPDGLVIGIDPAPVQNIALGPDMAEGRGTGTADIHHVSAPEPYRRLQHPTLPPPPRMTASIAALLARPLPALELPPAGEGREADLIRLCMVAATLCRQQADLVFLAGSTFDPSQGISGRLAELNRRLSLAYGAIGHIRARTSAGLRAKAMLIAASGRNGKHASLDDQPMVLSLLADCADLPA